MSGIERGVRRSFVRFRTAEGEFAVDVGHVREVRTTAGMLRLPEPGPHVVGFLAHGDGTLTVVAPLGAGGGHVLVLDPDGHPFGLLVQEVSGMLALDDAQIGPPPAGQAGDLVSGVVRGGDLVLIVDAVALGHILAR